MSQEVLEATSQGDVALVKDLKDKTGLLKQEIGKAIIGQDEIVENLLICLLAGGHCLLIGVPGLAKTLLVRTFSDALKIGFKRIQFTPDLMPSDITGTEIIEEDQTTGKRVYRFVEGPVFANVVLADEINRTPPKTQAALLEAMQEYSVTAAGENHELPLPFFVLATQNPIEQEGTYPLPEAQLDRFMFSLHVDYPSRKEEIEIVKRNTSAFSPTVEQVLSGKEVIDLQHLIRRVPVSEEMVEYAVSLATTTRPGNDNDEEMQAFMKKYVAWGAGPRASYYLILAAKARAILHGRYAVAEEDIRAVTGPVLRHRIVPTFRAEADGVATDHIVGKVLEGVAFGG
jgi:MoxR-like ATPase